MPRALDPGKARVLRCPSLLVLGDDRGHLRLVEGPHRRRPDVALRVSASANADSGSDELVHTNIDPEPARRHRDQPFGDTDDVVEPAIALVLALEERDQVLAAL